jgi:small subunit ribosomal protein S13
LSEEFKDFRHLVRISGFDIRGDKQAIAGLTHIRGIGRRMADAILKILDIPRETYIGLLSEKQVEEIDNIIKDPIKHGVPDWYVNHQKERRSGKDIHIIGSELALYDRQDIQRLTKIRCYRGMRHAAGLKVRGQRTKSTGRGGRSLGVSRKKLLKQAAEEKKGDK